MKKKPSYTASEKGEILKCYLQDKEPVSQICQKYNISEKDLKYWAGLKKYPKRWYELFSKL